VTTKRGAARLGTGTAPADAASSKKKPVTRQSAAALRPFPVPADTAADEGGRAALEAADPWVIACWATALRYLALTGAPFSVDSVTELGVPPLDRPCAAGALIAWDAAGGRIRPVGRVRSRRAFRRGAQVTLWVGTVCGLDIGEGRAR
jgi:hypothetical protein